MDACFEGFSVASILECFRFPLVLHRFAGARSVKKGGRWGKWSQGWGGYFFEEFLIAGFGRKKPLGRGEKNRVSVIRAAKRGRRHISIEVDC